MGKWGIQLFDDKRDGLFSVSDLGSPLGLQDGSFHPGGLFASVGQVGMGFGVSPPNPSSSPDNDSTKLPLADWYLKLVAPKEKIGVVGMADGEATVKKKKKGGLKLKIKVSDPSLRRLISGAVAGAISRTAVAPLETIRTHLMVGSSGNSTGEVFNNIMKTDGWKGLFRGNLVNVIRVAPSKAIEVIFLTGFLINPRDVVTGKWKDIAKSNVRGLPAEGWMTRDSRPFSRLFAFDTINKHLSAKLEEQPKIPIPASLIAGACAGVSSTLCTYPLELVKTRLTIEKDMYNGILDAFVKILTKEGPGELYRGLAPSVIGVIPYAATNYFAYDTLRRAYRKISKQEKIGNIETLLIGSLAGAISSSATFPLEVARKQMQVGALNGRHVYRNVIHALSSILEREGVAGLYKGLGPSCMKLVPAAGISFMCYEACKRVLVEEDQEA